MLASTYLLTYIHDIKVPMHDELLRGTLVAELKYPYFFSPCRCISGVELNEEYRSTGRGRRSGTLKSPVRSLFR